MLDALQGVAPTAYGVLTTRTPAIDPAEFYGARRQVYRALKRRWPDVEIAWLVEFTTGKGPRSGGLRRPHWNLLVKGIPDDDLGAAFDVMARVWCGQVDAEPQAQYLDAIGSAQQLVKYLALHFQKQSQAPPEGWHGHRFRTTGGYLWTDTPTARAAAVASLREKRELRRALQRGLVGEGAEAAVRQALELAAATSWSLVTLTREQQGLRPVPPRDSRRLAARDSARRTDGRPQPEGRRTADRPRALPGRLPEPALDERGVAPAAAPITGRSRALRSPPQ